MTIGGMHGIERRFGQVWCWLVVLGAKDDIHVLQVMKPLNRWFGSLNRIFL